MSNITLENHKSLINHINKLEESLSGVLVHINELRKLIGAEQLSLVTENPVSTPKEATTKTQPKKTTGTTGVVGMNGKAAHDKKDDLEKLTRLQLEIELGKFNIKIADVPKVGKTAKNIELIEAIKNARTGIIPPSKITTKKVVVPIKSSDKTSGNDKKKEIPKKKITPPKKNEKKSKKEITLNKSDVKSSDNQPETQSGNQITTDSLVKITETKKESSPKDTTQSSSIIPRKKTKKPVIISEDTSEEDESLMSSDLSSSGSSDDETTSDDTDTDDSDESSGSESS